MRIQKILVPVDFSPHSGVALEHAIGLAKTFGAQIHLLHAYHLPVQVATFDQRMPTDFLTSVRDAVARKLEESLQTVRGEGIEGEPHVVEGPPAPSIVDAAEKLGADLIVMGTRGNSGLKHVLLGSVAERTVRTAPCPVMTVKDEHE